MANAKIHKFGNTHFVSLPDDVLNALDLTEDQAVSVKVVNDHIVISVNEQESGLAERFADFDTETYFATKDEVEFDTHKPTRRERL